MSQYIEAESRERIRLRYEAMFWSAAFVAATVCCALLLINGGIVGTLLGIGAGMGALYSYVKRDETREEYLLKVSSGKDRMAAKHLANELGVNHNRMPEHAVAPQNAVSTAQPENVVSKVQEKLQETAHHAAEQPQKLAEQVWTQKIAEKAQDVTPSQNK